ncbi:MAG: hypothetical protein CMG50_04135 [Candidatus Marinimicrobia bacterium]|nr:hypothetical protein [Candidatus Neomarinimicrobiota bacterium]|tara:strand:- start:35541 stop:36404 length:864 start_codon:yes stop_codon:yes gene_type:complete
MNVVCTGSKNKPKISFVIESLKNLFDNSKHNLFMDEKLNGISNSSTFKYINLYNPDVKIDFVISIGGDGSILSAVRRMHNNQIPIIGIHIGNLGFLNKLNMDDYISIIKKILLSKSINFDNKTLLEATFINVDNGLQDSIFALNEIFINQGEISRLLTLNVEINNKYLNTYRCDGLIISTPLGSTAYSLSAGGPIVSYDVDCNIITPVSPHTLSSRPIIIRNNDIISIKCPDISTNYMLCSDGQDSRIIKNESEVTIKKSNILAKFLKFEHEQSYFDKLRSNLGWHN